MKLNIKNTAPSLPHYQRRSNMMSIIVALVTFVLVVGGVYLITKSLGNKTSTDNSQSVSSSVTPEVKSATETRTSESNSLILKDKSTEVTTPTVAETKPASNETEAPAPVQIPTKAQVDSTASQPKSTTPVDTTPKTISASQTTANNKLAVNQSIIKVISQSGNRFRVQVLNTGNQNGRYLVKDATVTLNLNGFVLQTNKVYQITGITETNGAISINLANTNAIQEVTV